MSNEGERQGRNRGTESSDELASFETVREIELERVRVRRKVAARQLLPPDAVDPPQEETTEQVKSSLVGVALSGGGIRSGAFSLGFLMGMCRGGVLRFVDYVSTVSGGGYAASTMSAEAVKRQHLAQASGASTPEQSQHIFEDPEGKVLVKPRAANNTARPYPRPMLELVREGSRWLRDRTAFESLNRFFFGGLATIIFSACWLLAICSLLSWLFRWLDHRPASDWLNALGMEGDVGKLITPSVLLFGIWVICWLVSVADHKRRARGVTARHVFWLWVVVTVLALVLIATSGEVDIKYWSESFGWNEEDVLAWKSRFSWILPALTAAILATLTPYLNVGLLLKSGRSNADAKQQFIFRLARLGLLWGVPLLMFSFFARENISGWDKRRDHRLGSSDLEETLLIDKLYSEYEVDRDATTKPVDWISKTPAVEPTHLTLADFARISWVKLQPTPHYPLPGTYLLTGKISPADLSDSSLPIEPGIVRLQQLQEESRRRKTLALARSNDERLKADHSWGDDASDLRFLSRLRIGLAFLLHPSDSDNKIATAARASAANRKWRREMLYALNQRLLSPSFYQTFEENLPRLKELYPELDESKIESRIAEAKMTERSAGAVVRNGGSLLNRSKDLLSDREQHVRHLLDSVPRMPVDPLEERQLEPTVPQWLSDIHSQPAVQHDLRLPPKPSNEEQQRFIPDHRERDLQELRLQQAERAVLKANRNLLEAVYPVEIRSFGKNAYAAHVLLKDQEARMMVFLWSAAIGLIAAFLADLNTLSWHGYYAERLASFWVGTGTGQTRSRKRYRDTSRPIRLRDLCTVQQGRPYHLINACTISFARDSNDLEHIHGLPVGPFLLSEQFLGSTALVNPPDAGVSAPDEPSTRPAFGPTSDWRHSDLTLSDAVALSGAAVSPWATPNHLTRAIMFVLNLRTGLWLANPVHRLLRNESMMRRFLHRSSFFPPIRFLWSWLTLSNPADWSHISVTDGGFYENLGLEPLLLRRCRLIFAVDATQDSEYHFDSLARVVRRCRMQYGIEFVDPVTRKPLSVPNDIVPGKSEGDGLTPSRRQFTVIEIDYSGMDSHAAPGDEEPDLADDERASINDQNEPRNALLVFVKANLVDALPIDVAQHAKRNSLFPNDPTSDQFFDTDKFESYRQLGDTAAGRIIEEVVSFKQAKDTLSISDQDDLYQKFRDTFTPSRPSAAHGRKPLESEIHRLLFELRKAVLSASPQVDRFEEAIDEMSIEEALPGLGYQLREAITGVVPPIPKHEHVFVRRLMALATTQLGRLKRNPQADNIRERLRKEPATCEWPSFIDDWSRTFPVSEKDRSQAALLLRAYLANGFCLSEGETLYAQELADEIV